MTCLPTTGRTSSVACLGEKPEIASDVTPVTVDARAMTGVARRREASCVWRQTVRWLMAPP